MSIDNGLPIRMIENCRQYRDGYGACHDTCFFKGSALKTCAERWRQLNFGTNEQSNEFIQEEYPGLGKCVRHVFNDKGECIARFKAKLKNTTI